jgi:hypothetical protein
MEERQSMYLPITQLQYSAITNSLWPQYSVHDGKKEGREGQRGGGREGKKKKLKWIAQNFEHVPKSFHISLIC